MRVRRIIAGLAFTSIAIVTWVVAGLQLAGGLLGIVPFTAPGAMIGLAGGWLSHLFRPQAYDWRRGRRAALIGAILLPPWIAALVTVAGMTTGGGAMVVVGGAWVVACVGVAAALLRWVSWHLDRQRRAARSPGVFPTRRRQTPRLRAPSRTGTFQSRWSPHGR